jgi:hypothetical protein
MPRFYFHLKAGAELIEDLEGTDLPDQDAARAVALASGRELWAEAILAGNDLPAEAFAIADEQGHQLIVPLTEALPPQLRNSR